MIKYLAYPLLISVLFIAHTCAASELMIFSASWCSACQQLKAAIDKEPDIVDGYTVSYVDFDANKDLAKKYRVTTLPTLIVTAEDGSTKRKVGYYGTADLRKWLSGEEAPRRRLRNIKNR